MVVKSYVQLYDEDFLYLYTADVLVLVIRILTTVEELKMGL